MSALSGKSGKVMYGSVVVAEIIDWTMSGFKMEIVKKDPALGETGANTYIALNLGDAGTINFTGNYDPTDSTGQQALATAAKTGLGLTNLYLYVNTSTFWRVGTGGQIFVLGGGEPTTMPRNGIGKVSFSCQVSGAFMEQVGTGT
jgi:hypothetical protein